MLNHGGIAVAAVPAVGLNPIVVDQHPATFELVCARVMSGTSSCVVLLVYRPKSSAVAAEFFNELAGILDRVIMYVDPIVIAGDFSLLGSGR